MARFQSILGFIDVVFNEIFVIINTLTKPRNEWPLVKSDFKQALRYMSDRIINLLNLKMVMHTK